FTKFSDTARMTAIPMWLMFWNAYSRRSAGLSSISCSISTRKGMATKNGSQLRSAFPVRLSALPPKKGIRAHPANPDRAGRARRKPRKERRRKRGRPRRGEATLPGAADRPPFPQNSSTDDRRREGWRDGLSYLLRGAAAEQAGGLHQQDEDEDPEGDRVAPGGAGVPGDELLGEAEQQTSQHGAGNVPDAAQHRGDEGLEARHQPHQGMHARVL